MAARDIIRIRRLIWAYFFLWIFEGALRKWVAPSLANPLLLVRDPVMLVIYYLMWRNGFFPKNAFIRYGLALALATFLIGLMVSDGALAVTLYGLRADYLHLPLIFIIPQMFTARDVHRVGYWTLLLSIPMAMLMALQFRSSPSAWINAGADEKFQQISSALGHIRAPGTFSFISGPIYFYSIVAAFLLYSQFVSNLYPWQLTVSSTLATMVAIVVSGSRSLGFAVAIVFVVALASGSLLQPRLVFRWLGCLAGLAFVMFYLSDLPLFRQGIDVFAARINGASNTENANGGIIGRVLGDYGGAWPALFESPLFGYGLGMGTAVGSALITGRIQYLLAEGEWSRVILESGPLLGGMFLLMRLSLALWIGSISLKCMAQRDPLALLLFGAGFVALINGNFGQATTLGFAVFTSGFCLAATRTSQRVGQASSRRTVVARPVPSTKLPTKPLLS